MYVNAKMIPVETVPGIRGGGNERECGKGKSSRIYLIHCKSLCKCYNVSQSSTDSKKKKVEIIIKILCVRRRESV
jgi:hypothetical protein